MRKKTEKKGKGLLVFCVLLTIIVLGFAFVRFYHSYNDRQWREDTDFVLFNSNNLTIEVYEPMLKKIVFYNLPKNWYVEVPGGYGFYKIQDIGALSRVEGKGESLLDESISNAFGIPFDATFATVNDWDRLMLWYSTMTYEKEDPVNLADSPLSTSENRIDGETIEKVDRNKVNEFFKQQLWDKTIADENLSVGIFNASTEPNIALIVSGKLERIGVHVTEIDNVEEQINGACEMRVKEDKKTSYTTQRLARLFHCRISDTAPNPRFDIMMLASTTL